VKAVLFALVLAEFVMVLEDGWLVIVGIGITLEHKQHAGLAHSTIAHGDDSQRDCLFRHVMIRVVPMKK
jgi:hypothetical protein